MPLAIAIGMLCYKMCSTIRLSLATLLFTRAKFNFVDHVKSRLRQWTPYRALDGRHGSKIESSASEHLLGALDLSGPTHPCKAGTS